MHHKEVKEKSDLSHQNEKMKTVMTLTEMITEIDSVNTCNLNIPDCW